MFNREDYYPYMFGVFVFAGLMAVPAIWGLFIELPFYRLIGGSLVGCFIFAQAHTRTGEFLFGRFVVGAGVGVLITLKASITSDAYLPGGLLGFAIMAGGGWLGLWLGRSTGITATFENANSTVLKTHDTTTTAAPAPITAPEDEVCSEMPDEQYSFSDIDYRTLLESSRQAWMRGDLSGVSDKFPEEASGMSPEEFSKQFDSYGQMARQVFDFAFKHSAPLDDEIVIAIEIEISTLCQLKNRNGDEGLCGATDQHGNVRIQGWRD